MATVLTINGVGYSYPTTGDQVWGAGATNWAVAVTNGMLQKAGGAFTLTANVNFGPTYGLLTAFYQSQTANPAVTGVLRLANASDAVSWRNAANSADLPLSVNASNQLTFNGSVVAAVGIPVPVTSGGTGLTSLNSGDTLYASAANTLINLAIGGVSTVWISTGLIPSWGQIVNASVSNAAAIAYTKLNLATSILNSDISAAAAIVYTKLSLSNSVVNADINSTAAIAYTKLNLSGAILNTDLAGAVSIAKGGTGQITQTAAFNALSPLTTKGDVPVYNGANVVRQGIGSDGQVFLADSTQANGLKWATLQQGAKNYITYANFENNATTGWSIAHTALASLIPTTVSNLGAALAGTQYIFTITSGNATVGATYTNNAQTFTVVNTIAAQVLLVCTGTGAPTASGTLTKSGGTGDATITFSAFQLTTASGNLSIATVSSGQLAGTYSLSLVSSAATVAGDMLISQAYTIDSEDQAKMITGKFYYKVQSGAANTNFSGTSANSYSVYIYDVFNAAWIQPAGVYGMTQNSGVGYCTFVWQTPINMTSFQVAIVFPNATTGASTLYFDDFVSGPQTSPVGVPASDLTSYAYTLFGTTTNPTPGTTTVNKASWARDADSMVLQFQFKQTAAGSAGSGNYLIPLPAGYNIDTSKCAIDTSGFGSAIGVGQVQFTGSSGSSAYVVAYSATQLAILYDGGTGSQSASFWGSGAGPLSTAAVNVSFTARVPILGWSSNVQMSADTDTRVVAFCANLTRAGSTISCSDLAGATANVIFNASAVDFDTHAGYTAATGVYTVPVAGIYEMNIYVEVSGSGGSQLGIQFWKNGVTTNNIGSDFRGSATIGGVATGLINCKAGDTLSTRITTNVTTPVFGGNGSPYLTIKRLCGPSVVAATESVNFSALGGVPGGTITGSDSITIYGGVVRDSHNAYNTGTGIYTVPVSGMYRVSAQTYMTFSAATVNQSCTTSPYKNAVQQAQGYNRLAGSLTAATTLVSFSFPCVAGDQISVKSSSGATTPVYGTSNSNFMSLERIGN